MDLHGSVLFFIAQLRYTLLYKNTSNILFLQMKIEAMNASNCVHFQTAEEKGI